MANSIKCTVIFANGAARRKMPTAFAPRYSLIGYWQKQVFYANRIVPDMDFPADPTKLWAEDVAGGYVAVSYPSSSGSPIRVTTEVVVNTGRAQILHDDQTKWKNRLNLPETYPLFESYFVTLNRAWQEFWFEQLKIMRPNWTRAMLVKAWASLTKNGRCWTDRHAVQNGYADFIQGINTNKQGIGYKTIDTGGNIVSVISGLKNMGGAGYYMVETLDGTKPPPDPQKINHFTRPDLIPLGTIRTKIILPDGRHRVDEFSQLGGVDVPSLLISNRPNYIRADWIRFIGQNERPIPYVK